jgi:hypothetical protein
MCSVLHQLSTGEWLIAREVIGVKSGEAKVMCALSSGEDFFVALADGETVDQGRDRVAGEINALLCNYFGAKAP